MTPEIFTMLGVAVTILVAIWNSNRSLRQEIAEVRDGLRKEIAEVRDGLREEIAEVRDGLREEIAEVRDGLREEIKEAHREIRDELTGIRTEIADVRKQIGALDSRIASAEGLVEGLRTAIARNAA